MIRWQTQHPNEPPSQILDRCQLDPLAAGGEMIYPPPMAIRLAADLRPSVDGSAVRTYQVAGQLQAASMPVA